MTNKPVSVARKELIDALADVINSSKLPAFIVAPILKDLYQEAQQMVDVEYKRDLAQYEQEEPPTAHQSVTEK